MSGYNIIIMPSPRKSIILNMPCNTGVRCNSIQSGVTISGQVITCQVSVSDIKFQVSGVKYNMSSTGVRYQTSSIAWQVPVSDIKCQV